MCMANPFSDYLGGIATPLGGIGSSITSIIGKVLVVVLVLGLVIGFLLWRKKRKQYNIPVTIWIPRSSGKIMDEVSCVGGYFRSKNPEGIMSFRLKRKGLAVIDIPPPNSKFLVGLSRKLYLVQKGADDFEPVLPDSFKTITTIKGKKRIAVVDLLAINQDATAWVEDNRESAKRRFTFSNFWEKYKDFIQITIFIFIVFLAIYINWQGLKDVTTALQSVANSLQCGGGIA